MAEITLAEVEASNYGRGAALVIPGARYAVVRMEPIGTGRIVIVRSTHRTYAAAARRLTTIVRGGTGHMSISHIEGRPQ